MGKNGDRAMVYAKMCIITLAHTRIANDQIRLCPDCAVKWRILTLEYLSP
jgi:hypothetical protein